MTSDSPGLPHPQAWLCRASEKLCLRPPGTLRTSRDPVSSQVPSPSPRAASSLNSSVDKELPACEGALFPTTQVELSECPSLYPLLLVPAPPSETPAQASSLCLGQSCTDRHPGPPTGAHTTVSQPLSWGPLDLFQVVSATLRCKTQDRKPHPWIATELIFTSFLIDAAPVNVA